MKTGMDRSIIMRFCGNNGWIVLGAMLLALVAICARTSAQEGERPEEEKEFFPELSVAPGVTVVKIDDTRARQRIPLGESPLASPRRGPAVALLAPTGLLPTRQLPPGGGGGTDTQPLILGPPVNDSCSMATVLPLGRPAIVQDTTGATSSPTDPIGGASCNIGRNNSVWFEFTAPSAGTLVLDNIGTSYGCGVAIYNGGAGSCPTPSVLLGCGVFARDRDLGLAAATLTVGQRVLVYAWAFGSGGGGTLVLNAQFGTPSNDDCSNPLTVTEGQNTFIGNLIDATADPNDPILCENPSFPSSGRTVWFEYTASQTGILYVDTLESTFDTTIALWDGDTATCPTPSTRLACNADIAENGESSAFARVTSGQTVLIEIDSGPLFPGRVPHLLMDIVLFPRPPNDDCENATVLTKGAPAAMLDTLGATERVTDPDNPCSVSQPNASRRSVWFRFTAPTDGTYTIDGIGSDYDPDIVVWDGSSGTCPTPTDLLVCFEGFNGADLCLFTGDELLIQVFQGSFASSDLVLNIDCAVKASPANDDFSQALPVYLVAGKFTDRRSTLGATDEGTDPEPTCGAIDDTRSVWYTSTSPIPVLATYQTDGSDFDTVISAYTGGPGSFVEVACNDDEDPNSPRSEISFTQLAGVTYSIMVTSSGSSRGGNLVFAGCQTQVAACGAACAIQNAWTARRSNLEITLECEDYLFTRSTDPNDPDDDIMLVSKFKVPEVGYPDGVCADYFFLRSNPKCPDNLDGEDLCFPLGGTPNLPVLILNDIAFPAAFFPPNPTAYEVLVAVAVDPACFPDTPGSDDAFDWWQVVEFHPAGPYLDLHPADCDGDGDKDCGFVLSGFQGFPIKPARDDCRPVFGSNLAFRLTECTDNYGAEVIEFFVNRRSHDLRCLNVFEAHPPLPARSFPGVMAGEDAETRPWSFTIQETP